LGGSRIGQNGRKIAQSGHTGPSCDADVTLDHYYCSHRWRRDRLSPLQRWTRPKSWTWSRWSPPKGRDSIVRQTV